MLPQGPFRAESELATYIISQSRNSGVMMGPIFVVDPYFARTLIDVWSSRSLLD